MPYLPKNWQQLANANKKPNRKFIESLKSKKGVLKLLPELHDEAFAEIDCLKCANCCKTISPRFKKPDIERISKHLGMKQSMLIETYLFLDEDGDYVVKSSPCPFLGVDNYCSIYEARPGDCRNYPYTDTDKFVHRPNTTLLNTEVCPAVFFVLEKLKEKL